MAAKKSDQPFFVLITDNRAPAGAEPAGDWGWLLRRGRESGWGFGHAVLGAADGRGGLYRESELPAGFQGGRLVLVDLAPLGHGEASPYQGESPPPLVQHWKSCAQQRGLALEPVVLADFSAAPAAPHRPRWLGRLTPRERMLSLLLTADQRREWFKDPARYGDLLAEGGFQGFLESQASFSPSATASFASGFWAAMLDTLGEAGRIRAFRDLTAVVFPRQLHDFNTTDQPVRELLLLAFHALQRLHHPWTAKGESLHCAPLLVLYHDRGFGFRDRYDTDPTRHFHQTDWYDPDRCAAFSLDRDKWESSDGWLDCLHRRWAAWSCRSQDKGALRLYGEKNGFEGSFGGTPEPSALRRYIDAILAKRLTFGRPLAHYGCTFFLPLILDQARLSLGASRRRPAAECFDRAIERQSRSGAIVRHRYTTRPMNADTLGAGAIGDREALEAEAYRFFEPQIRRFLFDTDTSPDPHRDPWRGPQGIEPIREWRWNRLQAEAESYCELTLEDPELPSGPPHRARIDSVRLYRYFNGIYLLGVSVTPQALAELGAARTRGGVVSHLEVGEGAAWWDDLLFATPARLQTLQALQFGHWLSFTRTARLLFQAFRAQWTERKIGRLSLLQGGELKTVAPRREHDPGAALFIPDQMGALLSPVVIWLLERFFGETLPCHCDAPGGNSLRAFFQGFEQLYDDRMFVNVAYGLPGPAPATGVGGDRSRELERLFSLALFVDRQEDAWLNGYAYDNEFVQQRLTQDAFPIWQQSGALFGYTDFSNAYLGYNRFFNHVIGPEHVPYHYERMLIVALFSQASLRYYSGRISVATEELTREVQTWGDTRFQQLRRDFILFTNHYWFHDLSAQMQGKEIFARQQAALGLEREYAFIKDEMDRADDFLEGVRDKRMQKISFWLGLIGIVAVYWTLLATIKDHAQIRGALTELWSNLLGASPPAAGPAPAPTPHQGLTFLAFIGYYLLPPGIALAAWRALKDRDTLLRRLWRSDPAFFGILYPASALIAASILFTGPLSIPLLIALGTISGLTALPRLRHRLCSTQRKPPQSCTQPPTPRRLRRLFCGRPR